MVLINTYFLLISVLTSDVSIIESIISTLVSVIDTYLKFYKNISKISYLYITSFNNYQSVEKPLLN